MKKLLATSVISLLLLPAAAFAQTPDTAYRSLLLQLIQLITQQIAILQAQLDAQDSATIAVMPTLGSNTPDITPTPTVTSHVTAPRIAALSITQGTLFVSSDKLLDLSKAIFPEGITISQILLDDTNGPKQSGQNVENKFIGYGRGATVPVYIYQAHLTGIGTEQFSITLTDTEGGTVTLPVQPK